MLFMSIMYTTASTSVFMPKYLQQQQQPSVRVARHTNAATTTQQGQQINAA
jgi:hypothetical protein